MITQRSTRTALAGPLGPALQLRQTPFQRCPPLGDFGVGHFGFGITVIGINAERNEKIADDILLERPALKIDACERRSIPYPSGRHNRDELGGRRWCRRWSCQPIAVAPIALWPRKIGIPAPWPRIFGWRHGKLPAQIADERDGYEQALI